MQARFVIDKISFVCLKSVYFIFISEGYFYWVQNSILTNFFLLLFLICCYCLLVLLFMRSLRSFLTLFLCIKCVFPHWFLFKIISLMLVSSNLITTWWCSFILISCTWSLFSSCSFRFHQIWKISTNISSNKFLVFHLNLLLAFCLHRY